MQAWEVTRLIRAMEVKGQYRTEKNVNFNERAGEKKVI